MQKHRREVYIGLKEMEKIVFTNGCFDIIHPGHIELLQKAKDLGTYLIVGINSDNSVRNIKGSKRPIFQAEDRKKILESFRWVDEVFIYDDLTPLNLIKKIKPDVLVKGGDWKESEIIGADFVKKMGGEVYTIPLSEGYSTTGIIEKVKRTGDAKNLETEKKDKSETEFIEKTLKKHIKVIENLTSEQTENIRISAELIINCFKEGKKVLPCGNGGSAADAQHIAAEFVGRYETERLALPAIALTTDTSILTAVTNDYEFDRVFSRQVEALAVEGDILLAISTSGNSENVLQAIMEAVKKGCRVIGLTGENGRKLASLCDVCVMVPAKKTAHIQEAHITIAHIWCELVDKSFSKN